MNLQTQPLESPRWLPIHVTEYHQMGEAGILDPGLRTELVNTRIMQMAPIGSEHADWVDRLTRYFARNLNDAITVRAQNPIDLDEGNEPQPDLALLRPRERPYREAHPRPEDVLLLIEVADSSLRYDRDTKIPLYARHRIPEVWLIDIAANRLEMYREPDGEEYRLVIKPRRDERIRPTSLPDIEVDLARLFLL